MRSVFAAVLAAVLLPSAAWAAVQVNLSTPYIAPGASGQVLFVDVFLTDLDDTDEQLHAFTVAVNGPVFQPGGVRFLPVTQAPSATHPFVFSGLESDVGDRNSTYNRIQVAGQLLDENAGVNVSPARNGLFSIPIVVPDNAPPGLFVVSIDPAMAQFVSPTQTIPVVIGPSVAILTPEPSSAALVLVGAVALLRRRHTPSAG